MKAWLSMIPVEGESNAASQLSAGSNTRAASPDSVCMSSTPLASAWTLIDCSFSVSLGVVATISLPQFLCGMPCSPQYWYSARLPLTHIRAIRLPAG